MKKSFLILLALLTTLPIMAQLNKKINEVGLIFSDASNFGVTYKTGTEKSLWRLNLLSISGDIKEESLEDYNFENNNLNGSVNIGKEFRKIIVKNLEFIYGADLSFTYMSQKGHQNFEDENKYIKYIIYEPGLNLVLGLNYIIKQKIVIGASVLPGINYAFGSYRSMYEDEENFVDISGFNYNLSNSSVQFVLAYRF